MYEALRPHVRDGGSEFALGPFLYSLCFITRARRCLDLGTGHGFSALAMALALKAMQEAPFPVREQHKTQRPDFDYGAWEARPAERFILTVDTMLHETAALALEGVEPYVRHLTGDIFTDATREAIAADAPYDVVFLDATKTREEVERYLPMTRKGGGYCVLHDWYGSHVSRFIPEGPRFIVLDTGYMSFACLEVR